MPHFDAMSIYLYYIVFFFIFCLLKSQNGFSLFYQLFFP